MNIKKLKNQVPQFLLKTFEILEVFATFYNYILE